MTNTKHQTRTGLPLIEAVQCLHGFVPPKQLDLVGSLGRLKAGTHFRDVLIELATTITNMPKTYDQDDKGDDAIVHLHYFYGSADWWITEKDCEPEQHQAFGFVNLGDPQNAELAYISLVELGSVPGVEIDLYWTPKTLGEVKAGVFKEIDT